MFEIKADSKLNLLVLRLEGFMTDDQLKQASDKCIAEAGKLKPGFTVINDISQMKPASPTGAEHIKRAQTSVIGKGVGKIIRVTENQISKMQFNRTSKEVGYNAVEVTSLDEAYRLVK
jgi:hypothetical protein